MTTPPTPTTPPTVMQAPEASMTQYEALRFYGWIRPIDYLALLAMFGLAVSFVFAVIYGKLTLTSVLLYVGLAISTVELWMVILMFRIMHFVLVVYSSVKLLPREAAQIVQAMNRMP